MWATEDEETTLRELVYGIAPPISPFLENTAVSAAACGVCSHALLCYCQEVFPNNFPNCCLSLLQIKLISSSHRRSGCREQ